MAYFKINAHDYSTYTSKLKITKTANYTSQTNANYDTVVDYINSKRKIEVEIIPLNDTVMKQLQDDISSLTMKVTFLNPVTGENTIISCMLPTADTEYYTIQTGKVSFKKLKLKFTEL